MRQKSSSHVSLREVSASKVSTSFPGLFPSSSHEEGKNPGNEVAKVSARGGIRLEGVDFMEEFCGINAHSVTCLY